MKWSRNDCENCIVKHCEKMHPAEAEPQKVPYSMKGLETWSTGIPFWKKKPNDLMLSGLNVQAFTLQSLLGGQMCHYWNQGAFTNPQVDCGLTSYNVIFSSMPPPPFLLLRWPTSPGCVRSFSPPPSSPVRRRYHATSTAWRSSKAARSSCPTMMTWSTGAAPASSAQVRNAPHSSLSVGGGGALFLSVWQFYVAFSLNEILQN